ncbi:MAG: histidine kinase, partial [Chloroflexota bacterium]|nr:histidine kinase [Chloroflexota bacterium]
MQTGRRISPVYGLFALFGLVLLILTAVFLFMPGVAYVIRAAAADLILDTAATVIAGTVAARAWLRYQDAGENDALFQGSAFLVLFVGGLLRLVMVGTDNASVAGYDPASPGQAPLYIWTLQRGIAAVLLLLAAVAALRRWRRPRHTVALLTLLVPAAAVLVLGALALSIHPGLPALVAADELARLVQSSPFVDPSVFVGLWAVAQLAIGAVFLAAAVGFVGMAARARNAGYPGYLSAGLLVAAFMQVHYAAAPGMYAGIITSGDLLRVGFYVLVLGGIAAATRADLAALVAANQTLERLRHSEAKRAIAEERARMARDVHDGLVQDLWLARLTGAQLREIPDLPPDGNEIVQRVDTILEGALAEAREVVLALQPELHGGFGELLDRFVADYSDRFSMDIEFHAEGQDVVLPGDVQRELLRISREALNNARKHADAGHVRVHLETR